jgi:hypothetical protein
VRAIAQQEGQRPGGCETDEGNDGKPQELPPAAPVSCLAESEAMIEQETQRYSDGVGKHDGNGVIAAGIG